MALIQSNTLKDCSDSLARYLPSGRMFESAWQTGTNLRGFIDALGSELCRVNDVINEFDILESGFGLFLSEWESALGIPDDCFTNTGTIAERQANIFVKLAMRGATTEEDYKNIASMLGYVIDVKVGSELSGFFTFDFPIIFFNNPSEQRFTIVIEYSDADEPTVNGFDYPFPIVFGGENNFNILRCVLLKIKPAHCNMIFINTAS